MVDTLSPAKRSQNMSKIRGSNTKPELVVRKYLHSHGFRYRLHVKGLPGSPDIVLKKYQAAVFVHGCFWHRHRNCKKAYTPKSRTEFWLKKFQSNTERDSRVLKELLQQGWRVLLVWECSLTGSKDNRRSSLASVEDWILSDATIGEVPVASVSRMMS